MAKTVGRNVVITSSQKIAGWLSDIQDAFFFITNSILFIVSQVMSAPCTYWFFKKMVGNGVAAILFTTAVETAGGYAAWELQRRKKDNMATAKKWHLPVALCQIAIAISVLMEGFIIWAYMTEHSTPLVLLEQLNIQDTALLVALGYVLSLIGVLIIGLHGQRVFWNLQVKQSMEALDAEQVLTVEAVEGEMLPEYVDNAPHIDLTSHTPQDALHTPVEDVPQDTPGVILEQYKFCEPCDFVAMNRHEWAGHCSGKMHKANMLQQEADMLAATTAGVIMPGDGTGAIG